MTKTPLDGVVRHIRKIVDIQRLAEATDGQLVERFVRSHEESAFAILLRRHGPMVLGVSRGVLHHVEDAEDVFQATFFLLAKKAGSIRKCQSVASWLHGTAYRLAVRAKAQRALRQSKERKASTTHRAMEEAWGELRPVLDEEMAKLPEKYRTALLLFYWKGKCQEEMARELGCPVGTIHSRLGRGRKLLQERLTRRGLTFSAGSFAALLIAGTSSAPVQATLLDCTRKICLPSGFAETLVSPSVAALVEEGFPALLSTKLKVAMAFFLAGGLVVGAGMGGGFLFADPVASPAALAHSSERSQQEPAEEAPSDRTTPEATQRVDVHISGGDATAWALVRIEPGRSAHVGEIQGVPIGDVTRDELIIVRAGKAYSVIDADVLRDLELARQPFQQIRDLHTRLRNESKQLRIRQENLQRQLQRNGYQLAHKTDAERRDRDRKFKELSNQESLLRNVAQRLQAINRNLQAIIPEEEAVRTEMVAKITQIFDSAFSRGLAYPISKEKR